MQIAGKCHCENISYVLHWPDDDAGVAVRICGCTFCVKHGGAWTSHPTSSLVARVRDPSNLSRYAFGTRTAEFYVCRHCGAVPFVVSEIERQLYAVVNVNTFDDREASSSLRTATDFDAEDTAGRLARRKRYWIPDVRISNAGR